MQTVKLSQPKRLLSLLLILCVMLTLTLLFTSPACAAALGPDSLMLAFDLSKTTLAPAEETTLTVSLANYSADMAGVRAIGVGINWDTEALEIVADSPATLLTTDTSLVLSTAYNASAGKVVFTYVSTGTAVTLEKGKTALFSFALRAKSGASGALTLNVELKAADASENYQVAVTNAPLINITSGADTPKTPPPTGTAPAAEPSGLPHTLARPAEPSAATPPATATAQEPKTYINPFVDVAESDWFYTDVMKAHKSAMVNGTSATTFSPNNNLTYAEAVKLAACMHQLYTRGEITLAGGSPWYQTYVDYAQANHIIARGYQWNAPASRAGYMEIFANALPEAALAAINSVADGSIPDVAMAYPGAAAIYKLYRAGIVQGVDAAHRADPDSTIKRSEVAAILTRMTDSSARLSLTLR